MRVLLSKCHFGADLRGRHRQAGSLAGAVHLLDDNAGVLVSLDIRKGEQESR